MKDSRLEIRIEEEKKELLKKIADKKGVKVSALLQEQINSIILEYLNI